MDYSKGTGFAATEAAELQQSWETQQEPFLPHRAEAYEVLVQFAAEVSGERSRPIRVLELAAGTGSITLRLLETLVEVDATLLEIDPVLLAIAGASIGDRARIVVADLSDPGWPGKLPHQDFDVVLSGNALHCFSAERLADLYRQVRGVVGAAASSPAALSRLLSGPGVAPRRFDGGRLCRHWHRVEQSGHHRAGGYLT